MIDNQLKFKKLVELNAKNRQDKLFVVHITKWSLAHMYPTGYAEKYLPEGTDLKSSQLIINYTCHVPQRYEVGDLVTLGSNFGTAQFISNYNIHAEREDLRNEFILTVDPPDCKDIDDALSITVELDYYKVGVHVADVSFLVKKDSFLDKEAFKRCVSFYPKSKEGPIHMLPSELSEYCCSLLPDRDRPCISVIFNVDFLGNIISHKIFRSLICSKKKLTYSEAQELMYPRTSLQAHSGDILRNTLLSLDAVAKLLRYKRLGKSRHFVQFEKSIDSTIGHDFAAHFLVEELMIVANTLVASHLAKRYPHCTPLRKQGVPDKEEFEAWLKNHDKFINFASFIQRFLPAMNVENSCQEKIEDVPILKEVAELLRQATGQKDAQRIREILCAEEFHPLHVVALNDWYDIQKTAEYVCIDSAHLNNSKHFCLGSKFYTHFTSPIRRYIDIVVHRQLISSLLKQKKPVYSKEEVTIICDQVNKKSSKAKKYNKLCSTLVIASLLKSRALFLPGILHQINDSSLSFALPGVPKLPISQRSIKFGLLDVCEKPVRAPDNKQVELNWKCRIYDTKHQETDGRLEKNTKPFSLPNDINIHHVPSELWHSLLATLEEGSDERLLLDTHKLLSVINCMNSNILELTSEMQETKIVQHHVPFALTLERGTAMHVQFGAESVRGYIQPVITQLNLTPQFGLCIQHMNDPVKCFADIATEPLANQYSSLEEYQSIWRPLINMEAAYSAMRETDPIIIKNVSVELKKDVSNKSGKYYGKLYLEKLFCRERSINLVKSLKSGDEELHDYLCLKFKLKSQKYEHSVVKSNVWICHALALYTSNCDAIERNSNKNTSLAASKFYVEFLVKHFIFKPPQELFDEADLRCTVELHAKPLPHRYISTCLFLQAF